MHGLSAYMHWVAVAQLSCILLYKPLDDPKISAASSVLSFLLIYHITATLSRYG